MAGIMMSFLKNRSPSATTVVLVLALTTVIEGSISYQLTFGRLANLISFQLKDAAQLTWIAIRALAVMIVIMLWLFNQKRLLFQAIILTNALMTMALITSAAALVDLLFSLPNKASEILLGDVVLMALANVLIFSIWYWLIDPPGIDDKPRIDEPWDFLFPQRADQLPNYDVWVPRYTDYLYLAFTTALAFSPADTVPLTRRAKMLMLLQALVSAATIVVIAGSAINNL